MTGRLSFMLSGAQLGITVTALLVGYAAEPYLGAGLAELLDVAGVPTTVALPLSLALALLIATVVQMVLGELAPKNLAIARAEQLALALSRSTLMYLKVAGPVITLFDKAAVRLLRRVGIEPIEELPSGATPKDLEQIIAESREEGHLNAEMSDLLDRGLDFRTLTAGEAMVPRVDVHTVRAHEPLSRVVELLDTGHSRFPVRGTEGVDDLVGVVGIADVLAVPPAERATTPVSAVVGPPLLVPETLPLPTVLDRLRVGHRQLACVVDEYGGFAGVITLEDIAEELVGPIRDEDDPPDRAPPGRTTAPGWCRPAGGSTRSPTAPASPCPRPPSTTPSPGSSCASWAGCPRWATGWRSPWWPTATPRPSGAPWSRFSRWTGTSPTRCGSGSPRPPPARRAAGAARGGGMSPVVALLVSVVLLALNAFFVAAEFALVASKRYRLEQAVAGGGGRGPVRPWTAYASCP